MLNSKWPKYLKSILGHSVVICDEITEVTRTIPTKTVPTKTILTKTIPIKTALTKTISTKTIPANFDKTKVTCKIKNHSGNFRKFYSPFY